MKKTKTRVVYAVLKEYENGATMEYLAQKYGITHGTISKWKKKIWNNLRKCSMF